MTMAWTWGLGRPSWGDDGIGAIEEEEEEEGVVLVWGAGVAVGLDCDENKGLCQYLYTDRGMSFFYIYYEWDGTTIIIQFY